MSHHSPTREPRTGFAKLLGSISASVHQNEALRVTIRAVAAAMISYGLSLALGLPDATWAVISSLYVLQTSVGGTINSAVERMLGTALGIVIGLAAVFIIGLEGWRGAVSLLLATALTAAIVAKRPNLQYALVIIAILVIAPGTDLVQAAVDKVLAIALGSAIGAAVGGLVFPVTAHGSGRRHLAAAIRHCGELVSISIDDTAPGREEHRLRTHEAIADEISTARSRVSRSRFLKKGRNLGVKETLQMVDRLWHTLAILDRLGGETKAGSFPAPLRNQLRATADATCRHLVELGDSVEADTSWSFSGSVEPEIARMIETLDRTSQERPHSSQRPETEQLLALTFGWRQISIDIKALESATRRLSTD